MLVPDEITPEIAPEIAPKHLRVAPKVSRRVLRQRRRARFAVAGVAALSVASMFLLVTFHVFAAQSSFQLDKLETERTNVQRQNEFLRNEVASLSSATAISQGAAALHMVRPPEVVLLNVPPPPIGVGSGKTLTSTPISMPAPAYHQLAAGP